MKNLLSLIILLISINIYSQNIQFTVNNIENHVITVEHFKPQTNGKFFYFSDFTIDEDGQNSSYTEIFQYWKCFTVQYNFGMNEAFKFSPVYLFGLSKDINIKDINFTFDLLYRYENSLITENKIIENSNYQLSMSYIYDSDNLTVNGFVDYWNIDRYIFNCQIWYKIDSNFQIGTKGYLSNEIPSNVSLGIKYLVD